MARRSILFLALVTLSLTSSATCQARLKAYRDLTLDQKIALQKSQDRLAIDDRYLLYLDAQRAHHRLSLTQYRFEEHNLLAMISAEAKYQNDLLAGDPLVSQELLDILHDVEKYTVLVPAYAAYFAAKIILQPGASASFSP